MCVRVCVSVRGVRAAPLAAPGLVVRGGTSGCVNIARIGTRPHGPALALVVAVVVARAKLVNCVRK